MPPFKKAAVTKASLKPDKRGKIAVRIFLMMEGREDVYPSTGNLREDLFVEDATVSEVAVALKDRLFGPDENSEETP